MTLALMKSVQPCVLEGLRELFSQVPAVLFSGEVLLTRCYSQTIALI